MIRACLLGGIAMMSFLSNSAQAKEHRWTHNGIRPLAMGNAYVAVADDYNALFYNPAGIARLKTWDGEFFSPRLEIAQNTVEFFQDLGELSSGGANGIETALEIFQKQTGKTHHFAVELTPHLIFKHFGFGFGVLIDTNMIVHSDIDVELDAGTELITPFSFGYNFLQDRLSVGASFKVRVEAGIDNSFNIQTIAAFAGDSDESEGVDEYIKGGYGLGSDVGILFTPIKTMEPTLGLSVTDVGGTQFTKFEIGGSNTELGAPDPILPSVNTGFSLKPYQKGKMYVMTSVDSHSINQPLHYTHKLNLGLEWGYGDIIKIQTGLKEGYATGGFQFDVGLLNMRFATYAVDHAPVVGTDDDLVERRYTLSLKLLI